MLIAEAGSLNPQDVPVQMIALGMIILAAHLFGKLCRRIGISEVTGQIIGGALVGPYALHVSGILSSDSASYDHAIHTFHFFVFVFLSMVAFGIGEELHRNRLKKVGKAALIICFIQGGLTWLLISVGMYYIGGQPLLDSLLIGSIGIATAPAVTFVLMNKLRIEGRLRHVLGSLVVIDDLIEVIIFSLLMQLSLQHQGKGAAATGGGGVWLPVGKEILFATLLGGAVYLVLRLLVRRHAGSLDHHEEEVAASDDGFLQRIFSEHPSPSAEILLLIIATVSLGAGIAYYFHLPFLLTAMFAGFLIANFHSQAIFDSLKIENVSALLNLGFFALIGAQIDLSSFTADSAMLVGIYIVTRMIGKLFGTWLGCRAVGEERKVRACLPGLMLPQAGVAAVEAVYAGTILGKPEITRTILPAIVFFEIAGVFLADHGLSKWRSWVSGEEDAQVDKPGEGPTDAAKLMLDYLSPEFIKLDIKRQSKKALIEELVDSALAASDQHIDRGQALQVLGEREQLSSTGFGNGVAFPHCRLMGLDKPVLVLARHESGMDYGSVDNVPCDLFLLMLTSARRPGEHLQILAAAAHLLAEESLRNELRNAANPEEALAVISALAKQA